MGFRINTNVAALNAKANADLNSKSLDASLSRLSSGLRINSAADDASGMAIADSLRSQANTLGQAISNGNDALGILQTADKAMDEQLKILDTIKTKATQAAQDGQSLKTRTMLQADINRLMEELDNIANTTSFNGKQLLSGNFINQEFQIGASSNQTVKATIGATQSSKIGLTRFETGGRIHTYRIRSNSTINLSDSELQIHIPRYMQSIYDSFNINIKEAKEYYSSMSMFYVLKNCFNDKILMENRYNAYLLEKAFFKFICERCLRIFLLKRDPCCIKIQIKKILKQYKNYRYVHLTNFYGAFIYFKIFKINIIKKYIRYLFFR